MTAQFAFGTLAFVKRLCAAGMEARQAEALAEALFDELATKDDLKDLELRPTIEWARWPPRVSPSSER